MGGGFQELGWLRTKAISLHRYIVYTSSAACCLILMDNWYKCMHNRKTLLFLLCMYNPIHIPCKD